MNYSEPTYPQEWGYPHVISGQAMAYGRVAASVGLAGRTLPPTPIDTWRYYSYEFLPFRAEAGGAVSTGLSFGYNSLNNAPSPSAQSTQQDATGKHMKSVK